MTESEFFIPDLCRVRAVFLLLVTSELLVLVLAIVQADRGWIDWNYFGLLSLFVQWTTLTSAALICLCEPGLHGCPSPVQRPPLSPLCCWMCWRSACLPTAYCTPGRRGRLAGRGQENAAGVTDRAHGAALFLPATPVATAAGGGNAGAPGIASGSHTAPLPVQQHEHHRQPDCGQPGTGGRGRAGSVGTVSRQPSHRRSADPAVQGTGTLPTLPCHRGTASGRPSEAGVAD